jgi:glucokinase
VTTIGIDLGGTKIQGVRLDGKDVAAEARVETPSTGPAAVVVAVAECVGELLGSTKVDRLRIGVGAPGAVDSGAGVVRRAPNLGGFDEPVALAELVARATGAQRVRLDNDVNVATLAEHRLGAARGVDDVLAVFAGTGVGGGLVLGGKLRHGATGAAGELGHMVVHEGGRRCGCGLAGHVEAYAGRASIEREARRRHAAGEATALVELAGDGRMKSGVLAKALEAGDAMAAELLDEAVHALGAGIASAVTLLDLALVVLGGGVADKLGPAFVGRVEEAVRSRLFLPTSPVRVVPASLGDLGGAIGAALLAAD